MSLLCNRIEEFSIEYLRGELSRELKISFDRHLELCSKCKRKFMLIKENFTTVYTKSKLPDNFNTMVMNSIDKSKYVKNRVIAPRKRLLLAAAVIVTVGIIAGFSEPLGQRIESLIYKLQGHKFYKGFDFTNEETKLNMEKSKEIYSKYITVVDEMLSNMKPGEVKTLELKEEAMAGLYLKLYKGDTNDIVNCCIDEERWRVRGEITMAFGTSSSSAEKIIEEGSFIALFDPLPADNASMSVKNIDNKTGSLTTYYEWDKTNHVSIQLSPTAVLPKSPQKELINIQQFEGIYEDINYQTGKEGQITIYMGDNKLLKALVIRTKYTDTMNKEKFIALVKTIKLYNEDANTIKPLNPESFFLGVLDVRVEDYYSEFMNVLNGKSRNFNIKVAEGVKLEGYEKTKENRNYALVYNNKSLNELSKYSNYPLLIHKDIFDKATGNTVKITGHGYSKSKEIFGFLDYKMGDKSKYGGYEIFEYKGRSMKYSDLDIIMEDFSGWNMETELIFDKKKNPYLVYKTSEAVVFRTVTTIDNKHVLYQIHLPKEILQDKSYEDFVNELQILH